VRGEWEVATNRREDLVWIDEAARVEHRRNLFSSRTEKDIGLVENDGLSTLGPAGQGSSCDCWRPRCLGTQLQLVEVLIDPKEEGVLDKSVLRGKP